jgi:hypothetical protein
MEGKVTGVSSETHPLVCVYLVRAAIDVRDYQFVEDVLRCKLSEGLVEAALRHAAEQGDTLALCRVLNVVDLRRHPLRNIVADIARSNGHTEFAGLWCDICDPNFGRYTL